MGLFDILKPPSKRRLRCAYCKVEDRELPYSKKFDGIEHLFCSKECSRNYRIQRKKAAKNPPSTGSSLPW